MRLPADELLMAHLDAAREHVLAAVSGLDDEQLNRVLVPSGWSIAGLLNHLTYDGEIFWLHAIAARDGVGVDSVRDGWAEPSDGAAAVERYRASVERARVLLETVDLAGVPAWWPPREVFPFPEFRTVRQCVARALAETSTHAGHLDIVRELIDGRQHLVVR